MLPICRVIQRRLVAGGIAFAMALVPLTVTAAGTSDVDALWNRPDGVSVDSAFYIVQTWWDGITRAAQKDPTQRGLDELAQANADLLNAYSLLQQQRTDPGPHPVVIIDPLLSSIYNLVTGSNVKAPVGALFSWVNQSVLHLEGRGSTDDIVRSLLKDYRAKQASATRDLQLGGADSSALLGANALRESAFLLKFRVVVTPSDGLAGLLNDAEHSTEALVVNANGAGNHADKANAGRGQGGNPPGNGQPQLKK